MAIKMVIGWRIQLMVRQAWTWFSDGDRLATFLTAAGGLGDAVGLVGRLGGWLGANATRPATTWWRWAHS